MGKLGKSRKRARRELATTLTIPKGKVNDADWETTLSVLKAMCADPETLRCRQAKEVRRQVYAVAKAIEEGDNVVRPAMSLCGQVGEAIHAAEWSRAVELLAAMETAGEMPKLGAMQRWVRDIFCRIIPEDGDQPEVAPTEESMAMVLDAVLRTVKQEPFVGTGDFTGKGFRTYPEWRFADKRGELGDPATVRCASETVKEQCFVVTEEKSWKAGLKIWGNKPGYFTLREPAPAITRTDVPFVAGGFALHNVLSSEDCDLVIQTAHTMGFEPEASYSFSGKVSPSAEGCTWLVEDSLCDALFERVRPFMPKTMCDGALAGINTRWRIYRYDTGSVYRPHVDGAWTGSGIRNGEYKKDAFDGDRWSRLTFLIYLNDDFEDGGTTFYSPTRSPGFVSALRIGPTKGSILCFPHGEGVPTIGLVHEGSAVTKGVKYVMRSDVLYMLPGK